MRPSSLFILIPIAAFALPAAAQYAPAPPQPQTREGYEYTACLELARSRPAAAEKSATAWRNQGGGAAAEHCLGVAMLNLGKYRPAAKLLTDTAAKSPIRDPELRANLFAQAANAWIIAGDDARAAGLLNQAIALAPKNPDFRIDRAIARASQGKNWEALDDLNEALTLAPDRPETLIFRASAWRRVGSVDLAAQDIGRALELRPDYPDALLERGHVRLAQGNAAGARADWERVLQIAVDGPLTNAARKNLQALDGR